MNIILSYQSYIVILTYSFVEPLAGPFECSPSSRSQAQRRSARLCEVRGSL